MRERSENTVLGGRIRRLREERGWSIDHLAAACAPVGAGATLLDASLLARIEAGEQPASPDEIGLLAEVFGVPAAELLPTNDNGVRAPRPPGSGPVDFFISYSLADDAWATWIADVLETAGYQVMIQAWDFGPGTHFLDFIDRGIREAAAVVAVLSRRYLASSYGRLEWMAALRAAQDPSMTKLLPVRIEDVLPDGLLASITFVDLVGLSDQEQARARLLERI